MRWPRRRRPSDEGSPPPGDATAADPFALARERMVAQQLKARGIGDERILEAFRRVPRHAFVEGEGEAAYGDHALPLSVGQTISQPYVVARMTQLATPPGGWEGARVLEVGTGSGYQAAILAELGASVVSIERHAELAETAVERLSDTGYADRVRVRVGDGTQGWAEGGPYRSILVTAGGPSIPQPLLEQLDPEGGRLVMPVGTRDSQMLTLVLRNGSEVESRELEPVVFVPLIGRFGVRGG
jgi:protein-L-isoaspartate(D-aspartate) O-methyltransferase